MPSSDLPNGQPADRPTASPTMRRRALASSTTGTVLEWYDFTLYGQAAALIFAGQFFPGDATAGLLAALGTYAVGYVARPVGGVVFGHVGDRFGRKPALVITLVMMGVATFLIGCLPTYDQIGIWAPILLVVLRLVQGAGAGAEYAGAVLVASEYAPEGRRGRYGSLPSVGYFGGVLLATGLFAAVSRLPDAQFESWGWRILFWLSAVIVLVGIWMRLRLVETPEFAASESSMEKESAPIVDVLRNERDAVGLAIGLNIGQAVYSTLIQVWILSYATTQLGVSRGTVLTGVFAGAALAIFTVPLFGALSDKVGRTPVISTASLLLAIYAFPFFWLVESGRDWMVVLAISLGVSTGIAAWFGAVPVAMTELFSVRVRYTGIALARETSGAIFGGTAPVLGAWLVAKTGDTDLVAMYMVAAALCCGYASLRMERVVKRARALGATDVHLSHQPPSTARSR